MTITNDFTTIEKAYEYLINEFGQEAADRIAALNEREMDRKTGISWSFSRNKFFSKPRVLVHQIPAEQ